MQPSVLVHSCDKVLLDPYIQNQLFSIESNQSYVVTRSWLMTMAEWLKASFWGFF